jgi:hypothetical protein
MCSLIISRKNSTTIIGFNRDEDYNRNFTLPVSNGSFMAPKDLVRGGTWLAVNYNLLTIGILNNELCAEVGPDLVKSRGEIVATLAKEYSEIDILNAAAKFKPREYNPFFLFLAHPEGLILITGEGRYGSEHLKIQAVEAPLGLTLIDNRGLRKLGAGVSPPKSEEDMQAWLTNPTYCKHSESWGTVSSSIITVGKNIIEWRHRIPPISKEACELSPINFSYNYKMSMYRGAK